jgi:hypothetical protein
MNAIAADTVFRVHAHAQRKERHHDASQHGRRRYHEYDYHLQSCCLSDVGTAKDRTRHDTRHGDNAYHAAILSEKAISDLGAGVGDRCLPHIVDGWRQGETQRFDRDRTASLETRCTKRKQCFRLVLVFATGFCGVNNTFK